MSEHGEALLQVEVKAPKFFYGYRVVIGGFLGMMVAFGTMYSFGVFFKPVLTEFGWTRAATSAAYSLNMVLNGIVAVITGRLTDRFGPRLVVSVCSLSLGLGYLLMSQISAVWQLYLFYGVLVSIGMTCAIPLMTTISRWFIKRRGFMTGVVVSGVGIGTIIMPPAASQLIANYQWRVSYIVVGIVALVLIMVAAQFLRRDPQQMGLLPYGAEEVKAEGVNLEAREFALSETIRTSQFWIFSLAYLSFTFAHATTIVHIVPHATDLGIPAVSAASILSVVGGASIGGRLGLGGASDRIGTKAALTVCFTLVLAAFVWILIAKELWMFYIFAAVFGLGYGGLVALMAPSVAGLFGLKSLGATLGMVSLIATIGSGLGPFVAGRIFDITNSYQLAFIISAVLGVAGLILLLFLKPTGKESRTNEAGKSA